jgi:hypothetical protein
MTMHRSVAGAGLFFALLSACSSTTSGTPGGGGDAAATDGGAVADGSADGAADVGAVDAAESGPLRDAADASNGDDRAEVGGEPLSCSTYCSALASGCSGTFEPYPSLTLCADECAVFASGSLADASVASSNSLACRQARASKTPLTNDDCLAAGPTGGGACGTRCQAYCELTFAICVPANRDAVNPFATVNDCLAACQNFTFDPSAPEFDGSGKNNLNCRQYYLQSAWGDTQGGTALVNCPYLGVSSAVCAN